MPGLAFCLDGDSVSRNDGCIFLCDTWGHNALEMAARTHLSLLERSKWLFEPARLRWGDRKSCSSSFVSAGALGNAARTRSKMVASAKALDIAWLGCSKTLYWLTFLRSNPLGSAGVHDIGARARSAPPDRRRFTGIGSMTVARSQDLR